MHFLRCLRPCVPMLLPLALPVLRAQQPVMPIVQASTIDAVAAGNAPAVLLFFVASDCPV